MDTVNVPLANPVEHDGKTYSALTFREPEVGDLLTADSFPDGLGQMVALLATVSDTPLPAFKKIKARDFKAIVKQTKSILGNELPSTTGG